MSDQMEIRKINTDADLDKAHEVRREVFVMEQRCPPELEWEHDEESVHFLAILNGMHCGAARWRKTNTGYKLERFAVLKAFRGKGVGSALVRAVLDDLPKDRSLRYLNAQIDAVPLYLKFGFTPKGDLFEEAGIIHREMILQAH